MKFKIKAGQRYYVEEYSPQNYLVHGKNVENPTYVKTFKKRNGEIGYAFNVQKQQINSRGIRF